METDDENPENTEIQYEFFDYEATENYSEPAATRNFDEVCDSDGDVDFDQLEFDEAVRQRQLEEEIQNATSVSFGMSDIHGV